MLAERRRIGEIGGSIDVDVCGGAALTVGHIGAVKTSEEVEHIVNRHEAVSGHIAGRGFAFVRNGVVVCVAASSAGQKDRLPSVANLSKLTCRNQAESGRSQPPPSNLVAFADVAPGGHSIMNRVELALRGRAAASVIERTEGVMSADGTRGPGSDRAQPFLSDLIIVT